MEKPPSKPSLSSERARWFQQGAICGAVAVVVIMMLLRELFKAFGVH